MHKIFVILVHSYLDVMYMHDIWIFLLHDFVAW